jgi:hypothetical protein
MSKRCKHVEQDGFHTCGSYAFNLYKDGIDQGDLCDVHYWQNKAQRPWVDLTDEDIALIDWESLVTKKDCVQAIEAKLKELNT